MTSLIDLWRAVDVDARLLVGDRDLLRRPVRGVVRTRASAPHLPVVAPGDLVLADAAVVEHMSAGRLIQALRETEAEPAGVVIAGHAERGELELPETALPILGTSLSASALAEAARRYLTDELEILGRRALELRVAMAERALTDPSPSAPAAVAAAAVRRGVAVAVAGRLLGVHPRPDGRDLAARFSATFYRLLAGTSARRPGERRTRDGLVLLEQPVRADAAVWLFDDLPFARVDEVAAESLALTLGALFRRPAPAHIETPQPGESPAAEAAAPHEADRLRRTVLAVARANGRVAPAARALGVHRNTVLYRLRRARHELGVDPRRADDAVRLLLEADGGES